MMFCQKETRSKEKKLEGSGQNGMSYIEDDDDTVTALLCAHVLGRQEREIPIAQSIIFQSNILN
jgi:hypothetical protein